MWGVFLAFTFLAVPAQAEDVREALARIEKSQIEIKADIGSIKSTVADLKSKHAEYDSNLGAFYRHHHIPKREEWATVVHRPEFRAVVSRVEGIERRMEWMLGAAAVLVMIFTWVGNSTRVEVRGLREERRREENED